MEDKGQDLVTKIEWGTKVVKHFGLGDVLIYAGPTEMTTRILIRRKGIVTHVFNGVDRFVGFCDECMDKKRFGIHKRKTLPDNRKWRYSNFKD